MSLKPQTFLILNLKMSDNKTYNTLTRMMVLDHIINQIPTENIPKFTKQSLIHIPQRSTVELMARELGAIAELQTAETILGNVNTTIGFDATT